MLKRVLNAAAWGYAGTTLKLVMQLGVQIVLARLLGPTEYGLFAIGVMAVSFALFFGDVASSALIPRQNLETEEIRFAFTWQMIVGISVTVIIALLAGAIAKFVNEPRAEYVIRALSLICLFNAVGGVSLALLRRNIDFKTIQIAQVIGYFVGYVLLAIPYAIFVGASVTALVIAWLGQVLVTSAIYIFKASHSFRPILRCNNGRELLTFGFHSFVSNLGTWSIMNIDKVVIARTFPVIQVGLYSTAYNLLSTPLTLIYSTLQQLTFSTGSQLSNNRAGQVLAALISLVVVFAGLGYVFSLIMAEPIVLLLYGEKWLAAVPFVKAFSVTMFFYAISGVITPLLWAHGAVRKDAIIQAFMAALIGIGALVLSHWSAIAVAWWVAMVFALRAAVLITTGLRVFPEIRHTLNGVLLKGAVFLLLSGVLFAIFDGYLSAQEFSIATRFICGLVIFLVIVVSTFKNRHMLGTDFADTVEMLLDKLLSSNTFMKLSRQKGGFND